MVAYDGIGVFNLTVFEIVAFTLVFAWLIAPRRDHAREPRGDGCRGRRHVAPARAVRAPRRRGAPCRAPPVRATGRVSAPPGGSRAPHRGRPNPRSRSTTCVRALRRADGSDEPPDAALLARVAGRLPDRDAGAGTAHAARQTDRRPSRTRMDDIVEIERNDEPQPLRPDRRRRARRLRASSAATPGRIVFTHTVVQPEFEGQGLGTRLARFVLDDAVARGERIVPECPFIAAYLARARRYEASVDWPDVAPVRSASAPAASPFDPHSGRCATPTTPLRIRANPSRPEIRLLARASRPGPTPVGSSLGSGSPSSVRVARRERSPWEAAVGWEVGFPPHRHVTPRFEGTGRVAPGRRRRTDVRAPHRSPRLRP